MPRQGTKVVTGLATQEMQDLLERPHRLPGWVEILAIVFLGIALTSVWAVWKGKYLGWDPRNYHYYSVYAWLNHRVTYNIEVGQEQTWLNPLILLPHYLAINHTPPAVAGAIFGAFGGINIILIYFLARCVVSTGGLLPAISVALLSAGLAIADPKFLEELGGSNSDVSVSIPVLAGLLAICWSHRREASARGRDLAYGFTGLFFGMAVGLKMTCAVFAIGLTLTLLALWFRLNIGARRFGFYAAGGALGYLLTAGYWNWFLWREYGNPIFPFFNSIFRSPWAIPENFEDLRFQPRSITGWITYPFEWFIGKHYVTSEAPFRDGRFALLVVLLAVTLLLGLWRKLRERSDAQKRDAARRLVEPEHFWLLIIFTAISYIVWITTFAVQRYFLPITLLAGLLIFLLLDALVPRLSAKVAIFALLAAFSMAWTRTYPWQHVRYGNDWFGVKLSPAMSAPNTLIIMLGGEPMGYVAPFLPPSGRVIYLSANMLLQPWTQLGKQASQIIATHKGPIRSLAASRLQSRDYFQLKRFGLVVNHTNCETFLSDVDHFTSCPIQREADLSRVFIRQSAGYRRR